MTNYSNTEKIIFKTLAWKQFLISAFDKTVFNQGPPTYSEGREKTSKHIHQAALKKPSKLTDPSLWPCKTANEDHVTQLKALYKASGYIYIQEQYPIKKTTHTHTTKYFTQQHTRQSSTTDTKPAHQCCLQRV